MNTYYEQQLDAILNGLWIDMEQRLITVKHDRSQTSYTPETLQATLSGLIYRYFYCAGHSELILSNTTTDQSFVDELSHRNHSVERFDNAWSVETVDMAGIPYATKGNDRRMLYAGEFVYDSPKRGPVQAGDSVRVLMHREHRDTQTGFYYVFSQTPGDESTTLQTRLYFHTSPAGSLWLVDWLTQTLNSYKIPFQFKCLNHPDLYGRSDSAVLYLQKPHVNLVLELLADVFSELSTWLQPATPLFTRQLAAGIGFAESPPNASESFGTSRCGLIAQGIAGAVQNQQPAESYRAAVLAVFEQIGLSIEEPYRNPCSAYSYAFPIYSVN
ncbi:T3SS effector HopA1 family protein [Spirosoma sp. SC4-14]|uniref:T3SS effector HopA1 family protein n=1 Tax=Spirosoma sp. SC4-14 TaxID=3128900 RepID=UPI0030CBE6EE